MGLNRFLEQSTVSVELVSLTWGNSLQCYCQCARSRALSIHQAGRLRGSTYPHLIKLSPLRPLESVQFSSLFSFQRNTKGAKHKVPSAEKDYGGHFGWIHVPWSYSVCQVAGTADDSLLLCSSIVFRLTSVEHCLHPLFVAKSGISDLFYFTPRNIGLCALPAAGNSFLLSVFT